MKSKILITTNPLNHEGGVVNYYKNFFSSFDSEEIELIHLSFGSRMEDFYSPLKKTLLYPIYYLLDYTRFIKNLIHDPKIKIVQVSPSLIPVPLMRDSLILIGAKLFRRKVVVFYRGWKEEIVGSLKSRPLLQWLFKFVYGKADVTIVLASHFKQDLIEMGWRSSEIVVTTTMYDAKEILPTLVRTNCVPRFLFLGRISHLKGIGELINACKLLAVKGVEFECVLVGHGDREGVIDNYKSLVDDYGLEKYIFFTGRLTGHNKYEAFSSSDIYVFPSWTEGCPNSVLEALGSGLFVISTDVGALRDIIQDGINGKFVRCKDYVHLADILEWACLNINEIRHKRQIIQEDARTKFEIEIIIEKFKNVYKRLICV